MAYKIHCKWNGNSKGAEELTTDRKGWSTLNDCGKESKKVSEQHRRREYYTGKWCIFTSTSIRKSVRH